MPPLHQANPRTAGDPLSRSQRIFCIERPGCMVSRPHSHPSYLAHARTAGPLWPKHRSAKSLAAVGWLQALTIRPAGDAGVSAVGELSLRCRERKKQTAPGSNRRRWRFDLFGHAPQRAPQITHQAFGDGGIRRRRRPILRVRAWVRPLDPADRFSARPHRRQRG